MADLAAALVRSGLLSRDAAARALAAAQDGDVASAALRLGLATENGLVRTLCDAYGCPGVDLSKSVVPTANVEVVSLAFCRQRRVVPVSVGRAEIVLAMADPEDYALADEVRFVTGRKVLRYVAVRAAIARALDGVAREAARRGAAWRGAEAPPLPDPAAAWVGVVHPSREDEAIDLPEVSSSMELLLVSDAIEKTPFAAPSPARPTRPPEHEPALPAAAAGRDEVTAVLSGAAAGKLALVADGGAEGRDELARLLGQLGCTVLQAANGRAALEIVREARPDLVVLEAMLPMVPGFEVCRAVKGDPVLRRTPVVLVSAIHRGTVAADAKAAFGADAFVERPFRPEEFVRLARGLVLGPDDDDPFVQAARAEAAARWREGARLLAAGRLDEAAVLLREAVAKDDLSAEAHYYLGLALARLGLLFEAAAALSRAAELRPDVDAAHQLLAQTYEQLGFRKSAREAWARAVEACRDPARRAELQARLMRLLGV